MGNWKLFDELKALLPTDVTYNDIRSVLMSAYVKPLSQAHEDLLLNLVRVARAKKAESTKFEQIYKQLLFLFVLNGERHSALTEISRAVNGLSAGQQTLVLIGGKSGIGKTSLASSARFLSEQFGATFIVARCAEQNVGSYSIWRDVTRSVARATNSSLNTLLAPIGDSETAHSPQQLFHSLSDWFHQQAKSEPLVILLDDIHWADEDSLETLDNLTRDHTEILSNVVDRPY